MGSLLDGIEATPAQRQAAKDTGSAETAKTVKLALAIVCLLVGGVLIAWNMGVFGGSSQSSVDPNVPAELTSQTPTAIVKPSATPTPIGNKPTTTIAPLR